METVKCYNQNLYTLWHQIEVGYNKERVSILAKIHQFEGVVNSWGGGQFSTDNMRTQTFKHYCNNLLTLYKYKKIVCLISLVVIVELRSKKAIAQSQCTFQGSRT